MNLISDEIVEHLKEGSWIKDLFEKGSQLKQIYSDDMIFDFSLGNPIIEPPTNFKTKLKELVINSPGNVHGYLSNQGLIGAREKIASFLADLYKHHFYQESIVITTGASGALNVALKSILNPNDEVIVLVPYFVEYKYYIRNAQGIPIYCNLDNDFQIDCDEISSKITARTKAIIINTPHNPTGCVFSNKSISELANLLKEREEKYNSNIYMLFDAPYTQLTYDNIKNVDPFKSYHRVIYASSFSKDLGLAGERIGFIALDKDTPGHDLLISAFTFSNRILGFVNAPALMQHVLANTDKLIIQKDAYKKHRDLTMNILEEADFDFKKTQGGFFIFPKSPLEDDLEFCNLAAEKFNILIVPGKSFGCPGYFRMSFSVKLETIEAARVPLKALKNYIDMNYY